MKNLILMIFGLLGLQVASAAILLPAYDSNCGPYPYKQDALGRISYLPILNSDSLSQGFIIRQEEAGLHNFVSSWVNHFASLGEQKFIFKSICYGYYDDESSTGPNALAYGDKAILVGTKMLRNIQDKVNEFIATRLNSLGEKGMPVSDIQANSARDFLLFHEFAHFLQRTNGYSFSGPTSKMIELNADCVGASLFTLGRIMNGVNISRDYFSAMIYAFALGDKNALASDHHGYPNERMEAFSTGMANIINMKNAGINLGNLKSTQIIEACRTQYR